MTEKTIGSPVLSIVPEPPSAATSTPPGTDHLVVRKRWFQQEALRKASALEVE
jgi:hypothetical protein